MKKLILFIALTEIILFSIKVYANPATGVTASALTNSGYIAYDPGNSIQNQQGEEIYRQKCAACHQPNGAGIPGTFPPLKGSDFLKSSSSSRLINQVMNGSSEPITVNGITYTSPMPPRVGNATDAAAVVNYILNAWGNNYGNVTWQDAKKIKPVKAHRNSSMMMNGMGTTVERGPGMGFWWIVGLVIMALVVWLAAVFLRRPPHHRYSQEESALDILKKRYANGEISKEEFDQMSRDLH